MGWAIAGGVGVLLTGLFVFLWIRGNKLAEKHQSNFDQGQKATATIDRVEQPGSMHSGQTSIVLRVHLTVDPPTGDPYPAVTGIRTQMVHIPNAQPGKTLSVRIALDNPDMVYPDVEWGEMEILTIGRAGRGMWKS